MKTKLLILFLTFFGGYIQAQTTQIRGTVTDEKNLPLDKVKISTVQGAVYETNSKGQFVFNYNTPMEGSLPKFSFTKDNYYSFLWVYDMVDNKKIVLHQKKSNLIRVTGIAVNKYGAPLSDEKILLRTEENPNSSYYDASKPLAITDEYGKFELFYEFPTSTASTNYKFYLRIERNMRPSSTKGVMDLEQGEIQIFRGNPEQKVKIVVKEFTKTSTNPTGSNSTPTKNEAASAIAKPKIEEIHSEIDEKNEEISGTTQVTAEQIEELKNYISYLETILEQNKLVFDKSALGQDSTIHADLKNKIGELKLKVAQKEKEVKVVKKKNTFLWLTIGILILVLIPTILAIVFFINNKKTQKLNVQLDHQNKALTLAYSNIKSSIQYAQRIQKSILVKPEVIKSHFDDSFVLYKPKDIVSGDFYWFSSLGDKIIITAVDCTGHGVPGAFMTMMGNSFLNEIVNVQKITEPSKIISELHKKIQEALKKGDSGSNDGMDIALVCIDKSARKIQFAGANNPLLFVSNQELQVVDAARGGIGGTKISEDVSFTDHEIDFSSIDAFYLFSDGFQDQFGGSENRKFMKKRFKQMLLDNSKKPFDEQSSLLNSALEEWKGKHEQTDDVLVIGVKVN